LDELTKRYREMTEKELKRQIAEIKNRKSKALAKIFVKPKTQERLPLNREEPKKLKEGEYRVQLVPLIGEPRKGVRITNGITLNEAVVAYVKGLKDLEAAKTLAKLANRQFGKLKMLEEIEKCKHFAVGDDVWFTKKGTVYCGMVVEIKSRKILVREVDEVPGTETLVPVRKANKGKVPKEYFAIGTIGDGVWRFGKAKRGGEVESKIESAEAVV
jgi:hypothetical protein